MTSRKVEFTVRVGREYSKEISHTMLNGKLVQRPTYTSTRCACFRKSERVEQSRQRLKRHRKPRMRHNAMHAPPGSSCTSSWVIHAHVCVHVLSAWLSYACRNALDPLRRCAGEASWCSSCQQNCGLGLPYDLARLVSSSQFRASVLDSYSV